MLWEPRHSCVGGQAPPSARHDLHILNSTPTRQLSFRLTPLFTAYTQAALAQMAVQEGNSRGPRGSQK